MKYPKTKIIRRRILYSLVLVILYSYHIKRPLLYFHYPRKHHFSTPTISKKTSLLYSHYIQENIISLLQPYQITHHWSTPTRSMKTFLLHSHYINENIIVLFLPYQWKHNCSATTTSMKTSLFYSYHINNIIVVLLPHQNIIHLHPLHRHRRHCSTHSPTSC